MFINTLITLAFALNHLQSIFKKPSFKPPFKLSRITLKLFLNFWQTLKNYFWKILNLKPTSKSYRKHFQTNGWKIGLWVQRLYWIFSPEHGPLKWEKIQYNRCNTSLCPWLTTLRYSDSWPPSHLTGQISRAVTD